MANRGWRPRSTSTTRRPRLSSASAASEPAKPEPTMATSASMRVSGSERHRGRRDRRRAGTMRQHALLEVHGLEAIAPRGDAVRARARTARDPRDRRRPVHGPAHGRAPARSCARCRRGPARGTIPPSANASIAPLPGRVGTSDTTDAPQANAASTERSSQASCSRGGTNGGEMSRNTRSATPRSRERAGGLREVLEREPLVQPIERVRVRGLQAHRDFELRRRRAGAAMAVERREQRSTRGADERGMRFDDHARQPGERAATPS